MKTLPLVLGILIIMSLLVGCAQKQNNETNNPATNNNNQINNANQIKNPVTTNDDSDVIEEINNTIVNDTNLDVGSLY